MQRRHFDFLLGAAGAMLAVVLIVLGVYFNDRYNFAHTNVRDQLKEQQIYFKDKALLTPEELDLPGVVKYAGQLVDDGEKARVYADELIALHLKTSGCVETDKAYYPECEYNGLTYAQLGVPQTELRTAVAEAQQAESPEVETLQGDLDRVTRIRDTVLRGETLRGLLLTTYGFWTFGQEAQLGMLVSWVAAAVLLLMALAGFIHAFRTPKDATI